MDYLEAKKLWDQKIRESALIEKEVLTIEATILCLQKEVEILESDLYGPAWNSEKNHRIAYGRALKKAGKTNIEIADAIGRSVHTVYALLRYGLKSIDTEVRKKVRERDKNKCRKCPSKNNLHTHHIGDPTNHKISNLITLCAKCHKKAHNKKKK